MRLIRAGTAEGMTLNSPGVLKADKATLAESLTPLPGPAGSKGVDSQCNRDSKKMPSWMGESPFPTPVGGYANLTVR